MDAPLGNVLLRSRPATPMTEPVVVSQSLLVIGAFYWVPAVFG